MRTTLVAMAALTGVVVACGASRFGVECRVDEATCDRALAAALALRDGRTEWSTVIVPPVPVQIGIGRWSVGSDVAGVVFRDIHGEVTAVALVGGAGPDGDHAWLVTGRWAAPYVAAADGERRAGRPE